MVYLKLGLFQYDEMSDNTFVNYNGDLFPANGPVIEADNSAFSFGDGLFESMRVTQGKICQFDLHYSRIVDGCNALGIELNPVHNINYFRQQVDALIAKNELVGGGKVRLHIFRQGGGKYSPNNNSAGFLLRTDHHPDDEYTLNQEGLTVDVYMEIFKPINALSRFKTSNALMYIMAARYAERKSLDDVLLVNSRNNILEASSSNLFIVSNGVLYTPALEDGCVGGTMRMTIINLALEHNVKVYECSLTPQNLLAADEVFLTNAISGIRWIKSYKSKRYFNKTSREMVDRLNAQVLAGRA